MFRLFVSNANCKHIIFGGCHDNGYIPNLEPYKRDESVLSRLTLLESTPAERSYTSLGFPIICLPSVFRGDQLPDSRALAASAAVYTPQPVFIQPFNPQISPMQAPPAKVAAPPSITATVPSPQLNVLAPIGPPPVVTRTQSNPPLATSTYAAVGQLEPGVKQISIAPTKTPAQAKCALLNADDQRLDPKLPKADGQSIVNLNRRIKEGKVCNNYHLLGNCANGSRCHYTHGERLGTKEQIALKQKARERVCPSRAECRGTYSLCLPSPICCSPLPRGLRYHKPSKVEEPLRFPQALRTTLLISTTCSFGRFLIYAPP